MSENRQEMMFGTIALQLGFVTVPQINECLAQQKHMQSVGGQPKRLGDLLVEKGLLSREQAEQVFRVQGQRGGHTQIAGYKILARIGHGAMGSVFKALQVSMDRVVALKVLAPKYASNTKFVERFFKEARAVAKLNHPNIIQGIDVGESNGIHYFAMEYIDGPTIGQLLRRGGALDERRCVAIMKEMARALDHAHRHALVHRDIKPDNIMLTRTGQAKLCDLGLAKVITADGPQAETGVSMGTPNYISPEQARGDADVDIRSDLYSMGATMYHMVTGQVPFFSESAAVVIARHLNEPPRDPREHNPIVSEPVARSILRMLQKDRAKRQQTPAEVALELEAILNAPPPGTPMMPGPGTPPPWQAPPPQPPPGEQRSSGVHDRPTNAPGAKFAKRRHIRRDY